MRKSRSIADTIRAYAKEVSATLTRLPIGSVQQIVEALEAALVGNKQVFLFGNGGGAATASHFACDLAKSTIAPGRPRFKAIALTDNLPLLSAWANDTAYENVFSEQLANLVQPGDIVIGFSGSGNSSNVLNAIKLANSVGAITIGLTGFDGGQLKGFAQICLVVPNNCMEQIEDVHLTLAHIISTCLKTV